MDKNENINLFLKCNDKEEARRLRILGLSMRQISKKLDIPVTSVRKMIGDIKLTNQQKGELLSNRKRTIKKCLKVDYNRNRIKIKGKIKIQFPNKMEKEDINNLIIQVLFKYIQDLHA